jgi:hypothetical protein
MRMADNKSLVARGDLAIQLGNTRAGLIEEL